MLRFFKQQTDSFVIVVNIGQKVCYSHHDTIVIVENLAAIVLKSGKAGNSNIL